MKAVILLRIAAGVAAVQGTAHGALFLRAKPRHGPVEVAVIQAMQSHRFDFAGATRSYWDFYFGYGLQAAAACLVEAILFWQLSSLARVNPKLVPPMVGLFILVNIGHALLTMRYFFYVPLVFDLLIVICLASTVIVAQP